ncbi:MAG: hypothetical protein E3J60_00620 [Dehalococcoidia bacterium]|nr:MAG: hypothetical protein E3J60_00620 [Dehalococcoidia bacterium]
MASIQQLLEALSTKGAAVTTSDLSKELGALSETTLKQLKREKAKKTVDGSSEEGWLITEAGKKALEQGIHPTMIDEGVTPRQQFEAIGQRIGIKGDRIVLASDIVWSGDYNDIKWVWQALGQADIADDLRGVWVNAWRAKLHKAIPPELETELTGAGKAAAAEEGKGVTPSKRGREYIIVDDEPVRVGENLGDYTLQDAKDILGIRALRSRFAGGAQAGAPASTPEKLSELLTALGPYLNKGSDVDALKEILADKLALQRQEILSHIPQGPPTQPKTFIEQLTDFIGVMGQVKEAGPTLKSILGIQEAPANSNPLSGIPVTVTGPDGKPAIMDFTQALDFRKFMAEERRADESHKTKLEVAKGFKDMLGKAGTALSHMAEGEEEE